MKSGRHSLIRTVAELKDRCELNPVTRCWNWVGATATDGTPRIYAFDNNLGEKRTMTGMVAAWNIAHGAGPLAGWIVGRSCGNRRCLNPVHLREFRNKAELGAHIRLAGWRVGNSTEQRRANARLASTAAGIEYTSPEVVRAIRAAPATVTGKALGLQFGIAHQTVSLIRRFKSHREVV